MDVFKTLGNENRRSMLKTLMRRPLHISALAKELDISVPVALRHVRLLEQAGFVTRSSLGNSHVIEINSRALSKIKSAYGLFEEPLSVEVKRGTPLIEALRKAIRLKVENSQDGAFISSVGGKHGYYIYEVNGRLSEKPVDKFLVEKDLTVEFKKLMPVVGKKIVVKAKP